MRSRVWAGVRIAAGIAIVGVLAVRLGTGPFLSGVRSVSSGAMAAAFAIAVVTTMCCAWRWRLVARGLGVPLPFGAAVVAYYRSQFLNGALPGGVVGDVHRGVRHGHASGDLGRGLRAVLWERVAGQVVQVGVIVVVLSVLPSPVRGWSQAVLATAVVGVLAIRTAAPVLPRVRSQRCKRVWWTITREVRAGVADRAVLPGVVVTSVAAFIGHVATFLIAARAVGVTESYSRLVPLAMFVLLAAAVPVNIGGWGPREGAAAWIFTAAGLGGSQGVAVGVAYGVMVTIASLPGAIVMLTNKPPRVARGEDSNRDPSRRDTQERAELVPAGGVLDG